MVQRAAACPRALALEAEQDGGGRRGFRRSPAAQAALGDRREPAAPAGPYAARALVGARGATISARKLAESLLDGAKRWGAPTAISRTSARAEHDAHGSGRHRTAGGGGGRARGHASATRARARAERAGRSPAPREPPRRARQPLREALELARRCGAAGLAKRTHDELQACGEKVRRYTPIGVESLTPSERRVAELAASGMTNRQIAQTLFLTIKTIETHLSAAYDKLGIRSRRQLVAALSQPRASG